MPRAARPFLVGQYRILVGALLLSLLGAGIWLVAIVFQVHELGGGPIDLSLRRDRQRRRPARSRCWSAG